MDAEQLKLIKSEFDQTELLLRKILELLEYQIEHSATTTPRFRK